MAFHTIHETRKLHNLVDERIAKLGLLPDEAVAAPLMRVTEIPYRSEGPLRVVAEIFIDKATAMERLLIVHHLLHDIEACENVHVDELFPVGRALVGSVDRADNLLPLLREIVALNV